MNKAFKNLLFLLAFIEGGGVMCIELCGAKILSPFFGTSIYVWAAVLGITLTALMCGYYLGGYISSKTQKKEIVFWLMLLAGCLVFLTPAISHFVLPYTLPLGIRLGSIISLLLFLFTPLLLFGATSPILINLLTTNNESGKSSGTVYAISTLGGIVVTFLVGFYTLPTFGITKTLWIYGTIVLIMSTLLLIISKRFKLSVFLVVASITILSGFYNPSNNSKIIYQSEGILGEVKVVDRVHFNENEQKNKEYRELMVNNITQTMVEKKNPDKSYWSYVDLLTNNIKIANKGNDVLLLGLGGGTLYKQLNKNDLEVDVVEIDERIEMVAKKYFDINPNLNVIIDDARHYINVSEKKYDVIIYDLYHSETPPVHLMTKEAFAEIKTILNPNGILIINFYGYINGDKGKGARSIYKTLINENYQVKLTATLGEEKYRNLLFISSPNQINLKNELKGVTIDEKEVDINDAELLTDDRPILEHLYLKAALDWRKNYNEVNANYFLNN